MDRSIFFATMRSKFKLSKLTQSQVAGIEAVLDQLEGLPLSWRAYALATAWHETNTTFGPVKEAYYLGTEQKAEAWRKTHLRYWPWYGRGLVQLTWEFNYKKADAECAFIGLTSPGAIMADPDLVMRIDIAAFILKQGMLQGWFTGAKFASCLPAAGVATREQYMRARTIINGRDKADLIEDYAQWFERALRDAGVS